MPFTPFHFGPAILIGLLMLNYLDFPTFILANIIIDWRAALAFIGFLDGPLHGWVHTYLGALLMAACLSAAMIKIRPLLDESLEEMKIVQEVNRRKIVLAAVSGVLLHVTIDAMHHPFMQPFAPFSFRPLLGTASTTELRTVLFVMLLLSYPVYLAHVSDRFALDLGELWTDS